jgi:thiosulfate/3-mercaptopyruvate sulfurtransferase
MKSDILLSTKRLNELMQTGRCTVVDCRFDFSDSGKGKADWLAGHIPGAFYAHLDNDLAGPVETQTGRHPLPEPSEFARFLASTGWSKGKLLVAYDEGSNAISARLWWLMRYFGQPSALLDGGLDAWVEAGLPLAACATRSEPSQPELLEANENMIVSSADIHRSLDSGALPILDARARERYSGQVEFLDTRAGHIPGALNRPFTDNLDSSGRFREPGWLKAQFESTPGLASPDDVVHSCGSGITACHNLFAMELAGLGLTRLYPGSWSEWIRDPARPVATGKNP